MPKGYNYKGKSKMMTLYNGKIKTVFKKGVQKDIVNITFKLKETNLTMYQLKAPC